jgi:protein O-GlcNAcase/histone acetyltransferase
MATDSEPTFLAGVIEGFYGAPWTQDERLELFQLMQQWGLNAYLYAPKDDLKHRGHWRESYTPSEAEVVSKLVEACHQHEARFFFALSPGLDIRYSNPTELELLKKRFAQMIGLGCRNFCLLFDDIPDQMDPADLERWGSLAAAQCGVTNELFRWTRAQAGGSRFLFCPTPYCGRMAERKLGGEGYLATVGRELLPDIDVFWTGPEIISREITLQHVTDLKGLLKRKPLIWDNLHANDYDGRRFFCGPYARDRELLGGVSGLLTNPNCEWALNYVPIRTLAEFVQGKGTWEPRDAYLKALEGWRRQFVTAGRQFEPEDLIAFADCYYLPHEEGACAEELYQRAGELLSRPPDQWGDRAEEFCRRAARLREFCYRLGEMQNRRLFNALWRRVWELREELDLLEKAVRSNSAGGARFAPFGSDFHLPKTYRGGLVARLQRLLIQRPDGQFEPSVTGQNEMGG